MNRLFQKFPLHFYLLITIGFSLSFCTGPETRMADEKTINAYETELGLLIDTINKLQVREKPAEFISLYVQTKQILDLLPDTSKIKYSASWKLIPKLDEVGAYEEAIKQSWKYLGHVELKNRGRTENDELNVYGLLAGMYNAIGKSDSSNIVYHLAIRKSMHHPDELRLSGPLNNMGLYFDNRGNYDSALVYFNLADSVLNADADKSDYWKKFHGTVRNNMANVYFDLGEFEKAKIYYQENFDLYKNLENEIGLIYSGISLVNANTALGICEGQEEALNAMSVKLNPLDFPQKANFNLYLWEVYSKLFQCTGDINNAFHYEQKRMHLKDSLHSTKEILIAKSNSQLSNYSANKFKHQLRVEKGEHEKDKLTASLRLWIIILIALGVTITPAILYYYYKQRIQQHAEKAKSHLSNQLLAEEKLKAQNQEKQFLDLELEYKKKDLADMAISISLKQEWAKKLNDQIIVIESLKGYKRSREIKKLKDEIRNVVYVDKKLEHFQKNIDTLSNEFYDKLYNQHPDLSKTERRFCTYFKLKMDTAQIAHLQNIDPSSVKVTKYRLKKKLKLQPDQKLESYLQSF